MGGLLVGRQLLGDRQLGLIPIASATGVGGGIAGAAAGSGLNVSAWRPIPDES